MVIAKGVVGKDGFKVREREKMIPKFCFASVFYILHFVFILFYRGLVVAKNFLPGHLSSCVEPFVACGAILWVA